MTKSPLTLILASTAEHPPGDGERLQKKLYVEYLTRILALGMSKHFVKPGFSKEYETWMILELKNPQHRKS